ncbi:hypothetical protein BX666DRAFT_1891437 [Dichotomocladium elegans]|nr:hypothetical protein BX666DRAFT_1891437 [Dichotomocladium elegans]
MLQEETTKAPADQPPLPPSSEATDSPSNIKSSPSLSPDLDIALSDSVKAAINAVSTSATSLTVSAGVVAAATTAAQEPSDRNNDLTEPPAPGPIPPPKNIQATRPYISSPPLPPLPTESVVPTNIQPNLLSPRDQEAADQAILEGINAFFNNKFSVARTSFESHARDDLLYSLWLSAMAVIKAILSNSAKDVEAAIDALNITYQFADGQVQAASAKKPLLDTVSHIFSNLMGTNTTGLPTNTAPLNHDELKDHPKFMSNGALRAHLIKAECGLLMSLVHLSQESVLGYLKMGFNLRRAYSSYSLVWQEYKKMGQDFHKYMDSNTVSAVQFGIGSVHLLLSSLPPKILKIISAFGWRADRNLGFALLKLCLESKCIRAPLASMMLLSYYVLLASHAPLVLSKSLIQPAVDCLLEARQTYPNSIFFLYFAGRVSRLTRNLPLSSQSFEYAHQVSLGDWAEVAMGSLASYEVALNLAMELKWTEAADAFATQVPVRSRPAFCKFFHGACLEMAGNRSEAIIAFAEAGKMVSKGASQIDHFVAESVKFYEQSGYQNLDLSLPALEIFLLWNLLPCMLDSALEKCLRMVDESLAKIYERERQEYQIRNVEIAPESSPPHYYNERATLLLIKCSILNALTRSNEAIPHLNWILDNKDKITYAKWVVPFTYWEGGVTSWCMEKYERAVELWHLALGVSGYTFEYRLAIRLNLVITHALDLGIGVPKASLEEASKVDKPEASNSTPLSQRVKRWSLPGNILSSTFAPSSTTSTPSASAQPSSTSGPHTPIKAPNAL